MKTIKAVRFKLFAVLFLLINVILLLAACSNIFEPGNFSLPRGNANVTVSIGGGNERTLLPQPKLFHHYDLEFERTDTVSDPVSLTITEPENSGIISIRPGEWKVTTKAYLDISGEYLLAAEGEADFTATPGNNTNVSIILQMPQTGGTGQFTYEIELPPEIEISSAFLTLTSLSDGENPATIDLLSPGGRQTVDIPSGFYLMSITVSDGILSAGRVEVVHIYPGMETIAEGVEYSFDISDFNVGVHYRGTAEIDSVYSQGYDVKLVHLYSDAAALIEIGAAEVSAGKWSLTVPMNLYRENVYARMELEKGSDILFSKIQGPFAVDTGGAEIDLEPAEIYGITLNRLGPDNTDLPAEFSISRLADVEGSSIILTAKPDDEVYYRLRSVVVKDGSVPVELTQLDNGQYSFDMPAADLVAEACFELNRDLVSMTISAGSGTAAQTYLNRDFDPLVKDYNGYVNSSNTTVILPGLIGSGNPASSQVKIRYSPVAPLDADHIVVSYLWNDSDWPSGNMTPVNSQKVTIRLTSNLNGDFEDETNTTRPYTDYTVTLSTTDNRPTITQFDFTVANNLLFISPNFTAPSKGNPTSFSSGNLVQSLEGKIDNTNGTITFFPAYPFPNNSDPWYASASRAVFPKQYYWWINNINNLSLVPTFTAESGVVSGGVTLSSGTTPISPLKNNIVKVGTDPNSRDYHIIFDSPQLDGIPVIRVTIPSTYNPLHPIDDFGRPLILKEDPYVVPDASYFIYDENGVITAQGTTQIKLRGNSSSGLEAENTSDWGKYVAGYPELPKLPYSLKFTSKQPVLGMPSHTRWNLLANVFDVSLIRSHVAFEMGGRVFADIDNSWTPHLRDVAFYLNDEYLGLYNLIEAIKLDANRLPITNVVSASNPTGGYILEVDFRAAPGRYNLPDKFRTTNLKNMANDPDEIPWWVVVEPSGTGDTPALLDDIHAKVQDWEDALFDPLFPNRSGGKTTFWDLMDMASLIDWYIVEEFTMATDSAFLASVYMYWDPVKEKFFMGPIWDHDSSMGNNEHDNYSPANNPSNYTNGFWLRNNSNYLTQVFKDQNFKDALKTRWNEIRYEIQELTSSGGFIDQRVELLQKAQEQNFKRYDFAWNFRGGLWFNGSGKRKPANHAAEITYLKTWINTRWTWFDTTMNRAGGF